MRARLLRGGRSVTEKDVLRLFLGVQVDLAIETLLHAYVALARTNGRSKEDVVKSVNDLLDREAAPGAWRN